MCGMMKLSREKPELKGGGQRSRGRRKLVSCRREERATSGVCVGRVRGDRFESACLPGSGPLWSRSQDGFPG